MINMQALVSTFEPTQTGYRVAQVAADDAVFSVAEGLMWVSCAEDVVADLFWYDPQDQSIKAFPVPAE